MEFDGKRVVEMRQLPRIVAATEIDRAVKVKVWRDGKAITLNASIAKMDEGETVAAIDTPQPGAAAEAEALTIDALGIGVSAPSAALRDRFELLDSVDGVVISEVDANGPAADEGIQPGDVLAEVSQEKVSSPADVKRLVDAAKAADKRSVLLLVESQGGFRFVAVRFR